MRTISFKAILFTVIIVSCGLFAVPASAGNELTPEGHKDPVILVHGYFGSILGKLSAEVYWSYYTTRFAIDGYKTYRIALPEGAIFADVVESANKLRDFVNEVRAKTGSDKVDIVCHSEGGLVARYYIENLGGVALVDDLVTISTPHRGTTVASIGPGIAARQMEVFSDFVQQLNSGNNQLGDIDYSAVHSNNDEIVFPCENGFFQGAVNANVNLLGHGGILFNEDVYRYVRGAVSTTISNNHRSLPIEIAKTSMVTNNPNVTLKIKAFNHHYPDEDMRQMRISNGRFLHGADWESISDTKAWTVDSGDDGLKAVYIKFRKSGNFLTPKESPTYVDYIFLDRTAPKGGIDITPTSTTDTTVPVKITATDNSDDYKTLKGWNFMIAYGIEDLGVKQMIISTDPNFTGASWQPVAGAASVNLGAGAGTKTVYLKLRDGAGNESKVYTDTVNVVDATSPNVTLIDESVRNPIVLVHGYMGSIVGDVSSYINWVYIYERLKADGFDVSRITLDDGALQDVRTSAEQLRGFVDGVLARTGAAKVDIVCHSEGGLVSTYYIKNLGGAPKVDDLVTFSTPFRGTTVASIGPGTASRQMEVGNDFIKQLAPETLVPGIEYTALHSNGDEIVVPGKNAFLKGALNVNWNIYGHASILFSPEPYAVMKAAVSKKRISAALPVRIDSTTMITSSASINAAITPYNHLDAGKQQTEMMVSLSATFNNASWEPVAAIKPISLAGQPDGMVGVHVKFRAAGGTESPSYVDYILLDRTPPAGSINVISTDTAAKTVKIGISASDASDKYCCLNLSNLLTSYGISGVGLADMMVSESAEFTGAAWEAVVAEKTLTISSGGGQKKIYAKFRDKAGNVSQPVSVSLQIFDGKQGFMAAETDKDPVVLVHGYGAIASDVTAYLNWIFYAEKLKAEGYDVSVIAISNGAMQDIKTSAGELLTFVQGVLARTGAPKVDIVCHSEGGLISRYFIQKMGGGALVDDLITISTPHRGTTVASIGPGEAARQMEIASAFLQNLNGANTTPGFVDYTAIFSNDDTTVFPSQNAFFDGALNLAANGYNHATILFNDEVYKWVKNALRLDVGHEPNELPIRIERSSFVTSSPSVSLTLNYYNHNSPLAEPAQMKISNKKLLDDASWQNVSNSAQWQLDSSSDGLKAVYVKYKAADGTESPAYVDYIVLDRTAPDATLIAETTADASKVSLLMSAIDNTDAYSRLNIADLGSSYGITGLGVKEMMISSSADFAGAAWEPFAAKKDWTFPEGNTDRKIYAKFRDAAGNESRIISTQAALPVTAEVSSAIDTLLHLDAGWNLMYIPADMPAEAKAALATLTSRSKQVFDIRSMLFTSANDALSKTGAAPFWVLAPEVSEKQLAFTATPAGPTRIELSQGWNIIGIQGYNEVQINNITVIEGAETMSLEAAAQSGIMLPVFMEFANDTYKQAESLLPFRAYLVKAKRACILNIP